LQEYFSKKSGIIERKLVAPAVLAVANLIGATASTVTSGTAIANLITSETAAYSKRLTEMMTSQVHQW
jgi:hypothetical protein